MSFEDPLDRILVDTLCTISNQTTIIQELVSSQRKLRDALDLAMKEIARLKAKASDSHNAVIA